MRKQKTLIEPDRRAIDLLLNNAASAHMTAPAEPVSQRRLEAARKLLARLDQMPPIEPPVGLMKKTMERIDQAAAMPRRFANLGAPSAFH
jgi:hypothetical protein